MRSRIPRAMTQTGRLSTKASKTLPSNMMHIPRRLPDNLNLGTGYGINVHIGRAGAWCLDLAKTYEPQAAAVERVLRVLPNLDVVATDKPPSAADVLFLERFAER